MDTYYTRVNTGNQLHINQLKISVDKNKFINFLRKSHGQGTGFCYF